MNHTKVKWRVGRKVGRTIYAMVGDEPSDDDILIGTMDTVRLAQAAISSHNLLLDVFKRANELAEIYDRDADRDS